MNNDTRAQVINLLENYSANERKISVLHFELDNYSSVPNNEMIEAMALTHGDGAGGSSGHISDKTLYIALNYQTKVDKMNGDAKEEIVTQLVELERNKKRLDYYISLLESRQAKVLQLVYFKKMTWEEVATRIGVAPRTARKIKDNAVDELVKLYDLTKVMK